MLIFAHSKVSGQQENCHSEESDAKDTKTQSSKCARKKLIYASPAELAGVDISNTRLNYSCKIIQKVNRQAEFKNMCKFWAKMCCFFIRPRCLITSHHHTHKNREIFKASVLI